MSILNDFERKLISLLKDNSRRSITELANILNVSRPTVQANITSLTDTGIIERFTIKMGNIKCSKSNDIKTFFFMKLTKPVCKKLYTQVKNWSEIQGIWSLSSSDLDMLLLVSAHSQEHIDLVRDKLATNPLVQDMHTTFVLKEWLHRL